MSAPKLSDIFYVGIDILASIRDTVTSTILAQLGDAVAQQAQSQNAEWWQHVGFASRPSKANAGKNAAQAIAIRRSDRDAVIASRDTRGQTIYGQLAEGETCVYATGPDGSSQGRLLLKADGSVNAYTQTSGGQSVLVSVTPTGVNFATPWGAFVMDSNGIRIGTAGGAALQLGADGNAAIIAKAIAVNGQSVSLGANATQPVIWGVTGVAGAASTSVKVAI